jgi:hypothetical protein
MVMKIMLLQALVVMKILTVMEATIMVVLSSLL